jgi:hypothetical protein
MLDGGGAGVQGMTGAVVESGEVSRRDATVAIAAMPSATE